MRKVTLGGLYMDQQIVIVERICHYEVFVGYIVQFPKPLLKSIECQRKFRNFIENCSYGQMDRFNANEEFIDIMIEIYGPE